MISIDRSEQLINTTNTHEDENTSTCSVDSDYLSPTGTQYDFVKVAVDFRHCEKHAFMRGLVQDGRMVEIEIGDKAKQPESGDLCGNCHTDLQTNVVLFLYPIV